MQMLSELVGLLVFVFLVWFATNVYEHGADATIDTILHGPHVEQKCK